MFKKKHVQFHTDASIDQAYGMLDSRTVKGSPAPNHPLETIKDTLRLDDKPFRGEVGPGSFRITRRRRGKDAARIKLEGKLEAKESGGTKVTATMSAPPMLIASLLAGLAALGILGVGTAMGELPAWVTLLFVAADIPAVWFANKMYERETSATFSALRDAIPAHVPEAVAPVSSEQEADPLKAGTADMTKL